MNDSFGNNKSNEQLYGPESNDPGGTGYHYDGPRGNSEFNEKSRKKKGGIFWRVFFGIILALSIMGNILLIVMLAGVIAVFSGGYYSSSSRIVEHQIQAGPSESKIAIIRVEGLIDDMCAADVSMQLKIAKEDPSVKAVILRTITPGGGVGASDRIHHQIKNLQEAGKPAVAFMQTVAASGGYYTSVACDKIVAEPTVITGSIGVIVSHMGLKELFEDKLGIKPMVVRSGPRKAWPSIFDEPNEMQREYLMEKLIEPAYDRFVELVADNRALLDLDETIELADGSIYTAKEAKKKKLIDKIGYIDEAIVAAKNLAGIIEARVVEYARPMTLSSILGVNSKSIINVDREMVEEFVTPKVMYLWEGY
jgi:protease-4